MQISLATFKATQKNETLPIETCTLANGLLPKMVETGLVAQAFKYSTREAEAGEFLGA